MMKALIAGAFATLLIPGPAFAVARKGMRFLNLTGQTLTEVALSPAGTQDYGPNQCGNGEGGPVRSDEDVQVKGVPPGPYDIRLKDEHGRVCFARSVEVSNHATFSVGAKDLVDCTP